MMVGNCLGEIMTGKFSEQSKQDVINVMADLCEECPAVLDDLFQVLLNKNLYPPSKFGYKIASKWINLKCMERYYYRTSSTGHPLSPSIFFDQFISHKYLVSTSGKGKGKIQFDTLEEAKAHCDARLRKKKYVLS